MFIDYVKDTKSWILLFGVSLMLTDVLIWIDKGLAIRTSSLIYLNLLLVAIFILFIIWRYKKEMQFTKVLIRISEEPLKDW